MFEQTPSYIHDKPPPTAMAIGGVVFAITAFAIVAIMDAFPDGYFDFWSSHVKFSDRYVIDTPGKFFLMQGVVFINTMFTRLIREKLGTWQINVVNYSKTSRNDIHASTSQIQWTIQAFYAYQQISYTVNVFFVFVSVYFVITQIVANGIIVWYTTRGFLEQKRGEDTLKGVKL